MGLEQYLTSESTEPLPEVKGFLVELVELEVLAVALDFEWFRASRKRDRATTTTTKPITSTKKLLELLAFCLVSNEFMASMD